MEPLKFIWKINWFETKTVDWISEKGIKEKK